MSSVASLIRQGLSLRDATAQLNRSKKKKADAAEVVVQEDEPTDAAD